MLNIFNLFLFLFAFWALLMLSSNNVTWSYTFIGLLLAAFVSFFSYKANLINKNSKLLYLSFGFYAHFLRIYFRNSFSSIKMIFLMAFAPNSLKPSVQIVSLDSNTEINYALLLSSINMTSGLFCFKDSVKEFKIHCVDDRYFKDFSLDSFIKTLSSVNEDDSI